MKGVMYMTGSRYRLDQKKEKQKKLAERRKAFLAKVKSADSIYRRQERELQRSIEAETDVYIGQFIRKIGFPVDNEGLLIGILLDAKKRLEEDPTGNLMNTYIARYTEFMKAKVASNE